MNDLEKKVREELTLNYGWNFVSCWGQDDETIGVMREVIKATSTVLNEVDSSEAKKCFFQDKDKPCYVISDLKCDECPHYK